MASSSTEQEAPNWLELPPEITSSILHRLPAVEILNSTQTVCLSWRRICKDPAMWKTITITEPDDAWDADYDLVSLTKQAVHRSSGELVEISLDSFCTDELLHHISQWYSFIYLFYYYYYYFFFNCKCRLYTVC